MCAPQCLPLPHLLGRLLPQALPLQQQIVDTQVQRRQLLLVCRDLCGGACMWVCM